MSLLRLYVLKKSIGKSYKSTCFSPLIGTPPIQFLRKDYHTTLPIQSIKYLSGNTGNSSVVSESSSTTSGKWNSHLSNYLLSRFQSTVGKSSAFTGKAQQMEFVQNYVKTKGMIPADYVTEEVDLFYNHLGIDDMYFEQETPESIGDNVCFFFPLIVTYHFQI